MEILLAGLLIAFVVGCVVLGLLVMLANARKRADTADARADEKIATATMHLSNRLRQQEKHLRAAAIRQSTAVVKGKVAEQLVPFGPEFGYNPRDARFLGSPVDFVVFEGLTEGDVTRVVFMEVKTGKYARLSRREKQVRDAVERAEVDYEILHVGGVK